MPCLNVRLSYFSAWLVVGWQVTHSLEECVRFKHVMEPHSLTANTDAGMSVPKCYVQLGNGVTLVRSLLFRARGFRPYLDCPDLSHN